MYSFFIYINMGKFKTKRRRTKNKKKILEIILIILFFILFIFFSTRELSNNYTTFINFLLDEQRIIENDSNNLFGLWTKNLDLLIPNYYLKSNNENNSVEMTYNNVLKPMIYIYNTHDEEKYNDEISLFGINNDIYSISDFLCEKLNKKGLVSVKETKRVSEYLEKENLAYKESYKISRRFLEDVKDMYPTLNYFLDIHRDSVSSEHTKVTINNIDYARILFVLGKENPNYQENLVLINKLNDYLNKYYNGLSRGIYEKAGSGVNGVYNQDFSSNCLLIELGGVDNNLREVVNSTEILVEALYYVIGGDNEKSS